IFDHVGGGFARYSVDAQWTIPHFEKMLYDNGPLLRLYADAWVLTGEALFRDACEQTAAWLLRDMRSPEGGFYSSLDADSEHEEGKFYVWTPDEVRGLLTPEEFAVVAKRFGLDGPPNFEEAHWHLRMMEPLDAVAAGVSLSEERAQALIDSARAKLFAAREKRIHPGRDDKILTSWNALAIQGLAHAGLALGRSDWVDAAQGGFDFLRARLWKDGRLLATYKDGRAHLNAYLDDYAFLLAAALELLQARFSSDVLGFAQTLADTLLAQFEDGEHGGFFFTGHDHEKLVHRGKPGHDNATPSGNGTAALALQRLALLTGNTRYGEAAERTLALFHGQFQPRPTGFATLLMALEEQLTPTRTIILRGPQAAAADWRTRLANRYRPATVTLAIPDGAARLPEVLDKPAGRDGGVNAWVCEGVTCLAPVSSLPELERVLDGAPS
ncbi:MAG TPA: thioredoxin, partial [Burkholderiales bacterium]|nr:thioredoxin [Burkholderiales bacterium]